VFEYRYGQEFLLFYVLKILGPTQPPNQKISYALSLGVNRPGCKAGYHLQLVSRTIKLESLYPLPDTSSFSQNKGNSLKVVITIL
jgi:hypothetical protein